MVVAQFAARIALSGSSYQWASRLANPKVGWFFGWLSFWYLALSVVTMANAMASQALMPLLGLDADEEVARILTVVILVVQAVLVIASTRLLGMITSAAVAVELGIIAVLVIALLLSSPSPAAATSAISRPAVCRLATRTTSRSAEG